MIHRVKCATVLVSLTILLSFNVVGANRMSKIPMRGGCYRLSAEVPELRLQDEAVVLRCSSLEHFLRRQGFSPSEGTMSFLRLDRAGREEPVPAEESARVQAQQRRLWFLPAQAPDSGTYSCIFRNASYCCASTITLRVCETGQPGCLDAISYPKLARFGQNMKLSCHHINEFDITGNLNWYKEAAPIDLSANWTRYRRDTSTSLTIQNVGSTDEGFYTCRLQILFNDTEYTVTRVTKLSVTAPEPRPTLPSTSPSCSPVTLEAVPPKIVDPVNGTFFPSTLGSSLLIMCKVSLWDQSVDSTEVTWLLNGQKVQEYSLSGHTLLGEKRVTVGKGVTYVELGLVFLELFEEDTRAEIKCVAQNRRGTDEVAVQIRLEESTLTWFIVAAAGTVCFLLVACVILYQLLKTKRKTDYILARQNSTF